ncbi:hypothetical protein BC828DRAFT_412370 [Blastocladiella britannica]|nr:hypothetical protein BC828DRAFT_412370 [Blastocladiella britannica]
MSFFPATTLPGTLMPPTSVLEVEMADSHVFTSMVDDAMPIDLPQVVVNGDGEYDQGAMSTSRAGTPLSCMDVDGAAAAPDVDMDAESDFASMSDWADTSDMVMRDLVAPVPTAAAIHGAVVTTSTIDIDATAFDPATEPTAQLLPDLAVVPQLGDDTVMILALGDDAAMISAGDDATLIPTGDGDATTTTDDAVPVPSGGESAVAVADVPADEIDNAHVEGDNNNNDNIDNQNDTNGNEYDNVNDEEGESDQEEYSANLAMTFRGASHVLFDAHRDGALFVDPSDVDRLFYDETLNEFMRTAKTHFGIDGTSVALEFSNLDGLLIHEGTDLAYENALCTFWNLHTTLHPKTAEPLQLVLRETGSSAQRKLDELIRRASSMLEANDLSGSGDEDDGLPAADEETPAILEKEGSLLPEAMAAEPANGADVDEDVGNVGDSEVPDTSATSLVVVEEEVLASPQAPPALLAVSAAATPMPSPLITPRPATTLLAYEEEEEDDDLDDVPLPVLPLASAAGSRSGSVVVSRQGSPSLGSGGSPTMTTTTLVVAAAASEHLLATTPLVVSPTRITADPAAAAMVDVPHPMDSATMTTTILPVKGGIIQDDENTVVGRKRPLGMVQDDDDVDSVQDGAPTAAAVTAAAADEHVAKRMRLDGPERALE